MPLSRLSYAPGTMSQGLADKGSCISFCGLASHPFGSWVEQRQPDLMWLRDLLPQDFKQVRSIIYGYDTHLLKSESFQGIEDIAIPLISELGLIGRSLKSVKPAVILAHSLGGIVLKCALLEMANSGQAEELMLDSIREVIFLGVPNKGLEMSHWLPMVECQLSEPLIRLLSPESRYLEDLDERLMGISTVRNMRLVSFYETERSRTAAVCSDWLCTWPDMLTPVAKYINPHMGNDWPAQDSCGQDLCNPTRFTKVRYSSNQSESFQHG